MLKSRLPIAVLALTLPLCSQARLTRHVGTSAGDFFGRSVACVGDVDADGFPDLVVGADGDDNIAPDCGSARCISGRTGKTLWTLDGNSLGDYLGYAVDGAGDVNADGYADVVVGAPGDDPNNIFDAGSVYVVSGRSGSVIHTLNGTGIEESLGYSVAGAGDIDADGFDDVIAGAWSHRAAMGMRTGCARVYSGRTGRILHTFVGRTANEYFGFSVGRAGDVDLDGFGDVVVGSPGTSTAFNHAGAARVFSGRTGVQLFQFVGTSAFAFCGKAVGTPGDLDGDHHDDIMVSSLFDNRRGPNHGSVDVYSGKTGTLIHSVYGPAQFGFFGYSCAGAGDVDGDGVPDLVVGAPLESGTFQYAGAAYVYSGKSGLPIKKLSGTARADGFGISVGGGCDHNSDGFAEVLVGAYLEDQSQRANSSSVHIVDFGFMGTPARVREFGTACRTSTGWSPRVGLRGRAAIGSRFDITLRGALPASTAFLLIGARKQVALTPYGFPGCTTYAITGTTRLSAQVSMTGHASAALRLPPTPATIGLSFVAQWAIADSRANLGGYVFSNALEMTIGT